MTYHAGLLRSFSRQLALLRAAAGDPTQEVMAAQMRCSGAKVSRILMGNRAISFADLRLLLSVLDADEETRERMSNTWFQLEGSTPAFASWKDILSAQEIEYYEALQHTDLAWLAGNQLVPVVLRVPAYHEAVLSINQLNPARWTQLLPLVQEVHNTERAMHVMLDESVFLRWRTPGFHAQLDALLAADEAGASIQVIPFERGLHRGMLQAFSILCWHDDPSATRMCVCWIHKQVDWVADVTRQNALATDWRTMVAIGTEPERLPAIIELAHRQTKRGLRTVIAA